LNCFRSRRSSEGERDQSAGDGIRRLVVSYIGGAGFSIAVALYFWPTEQRYLALGLLA